VRALLMLDGAGAVSGAGDALRRALVKVAAVIAIESEPGLISEAATALIPGRTYLEKQGSVTNLEGRVQRIRAALPPATPVPQETRILARLAAELGAPGWPEDPVEVHRAMLDDVPAYGAAGNGGRAVFTLAEPAAGTARPGRRR
jgi:predicted molibdopterin-dependent oxidoreductase YjgC